MDNNFIFFINESFSTYYKNKPSILFKIFSDLYSSTEENEDYVLRQFDQIKKDIKISSLNDYIYKNLSIRPDYHFINGVHKIDNLELGIYFKLTVKENFIHVVSNGKINIIVDVLNNYSKQFFIIDFDKNNYCWLKDFSYNLVSY